MHRKQRSHNRVLGLMFAFLTLIGVVSFAAPASASGVPYPYAVFGQSTYVPDNAVQYFDDQPFRQYKPSATTAMGQPLFVDHTECFVISHGQNSMAAFLQLLYTGQAQQGARNYLGDEDGQIYGLAYYIHEKLGHNNANGASLTRSDLVTGIPQCRSQELPPTQPNDPGSNVVPSTARPASFTQQTYTAPPAGQFRRNAKTGTANPTNSCYYVQKNGAALIAFGEMVRTGQYQEQWGTYLGGSDSELYYLAMGVRKQLLDGDQTTVNYGDYYSKGIPVCGWV